MNSAADGFWDDLLLALEEEGRIVPIVGRDLLLVETETGPRLFHQIVAERLAAELKVPSDSLPLNFDTNDVVCAYKDFRGDPVSINTRVLRILKGLKVSPPEPLRLLADIPAFRLFVSTTYDTLLEEALTTVRGRPPVVVAFPPVSNTTDLDDQQLQERGSFVFQVLGQRSAAAPFAVTEGQVLEQMHEFMSGPRRPEKLINRLHESHLLFIGVSFPDWLARFLLRLARAKPLWDSRTMMEFIADSGSARHEFELFLRHFSPARSHWFTGGSPIEFVRELHRRFKAVNTGGARRNPLEKPQNMVPGSIFISYASEDREAAFRLADVLTAAGLEVWIDRRLNPGDDYRNVIESNIRECCAFVAVLSQNTQNDQPRWFRKEWERACDRAKDYFGTNRAFLFPVVVDDTPKADLKELRNEIFGRTCPSARGGEAPAELIQRLETAQQAWRMDHAQT